GAAEAAHERGRQLRVLEIADDPAASLAHVDRGARIVELDAHLAGAVRTATEVDVADRARAGGSGRAARGGLRRERRLGTRRALADGDVDAVALYARLVRRHRGHVQHDARAA